MKRLLILLAMIVIFSGCAHNPYRKVLKPYMKENRYKMGRHVMVSGITTYLDMGYDMKEAVDSARAKYVRVLIHLELNSPRQLRRDDLTRINY